MRRYELALVASAEIPEPEHDKLVTAYEELIAERGGIVHKVDRWGRRKLAYPIRKLTEGNYTFILFDAEPDVERELLRRLRLSDKFLRFMVVRADDERIPTDEEKEALAQARAEILRKAEERAQREAEEALRAERGESAGEDESSGEAEAAGEAPEAVVEDAPAAAETAGSDDEPSAAEPAPEPAPVEATDEEETP